MGITRGEIILTIACIGVGFPALYWLLRSWGTREYILWWVVLISGAVNLLLLPALYFAGTDLCFVSEYCQRLDRDAEAAHQRRLAEQARLDAIEAERIEKERRDRPPPR